jgi:hypothetical protein
VFTPQWCEHTLSRSWHGKLYFWARFDTDKGGKDTNGYPPGGNHWCPSHWNPFDLPPEPNWRTNQMNPRPLARTELTWKCNFTSHNLPVSYPCWSNVAKHTHTSLWSDSCLSNIVCVLKLTHFGFQTTLPPKFNTSEKENITTQGMHVQRSLSCLSNKHSSPVSSL